MIRFALPLTLPLTLLALPAQADTVEAQFDCAFEEICSEDGCAVVEAQRGRLAVMKDGSASLTWDARPDTPLRFSYTVTPSGTVMANGTEGTDLLLMALASGREGGEVAMTRLQADGRQDKIVGRCE